MRQTMLTAVMAALVSGLVVWGLGWPKEGTVARESAYERVIRTGTLRCGYGEWAPAVMKDPKTGKMSGFFVEMLDAMGRMAGFRVDWVGEVDWGQIDAALKSGKVDAFCAAMAGDAYRARYLAYSHPVSYWSFDVLVRADDTRFPADRELTVADIDKPEFGMAYTEGDVLEEIVKTELPHIRRVPLPPLGSPADNVMNLMARKTDLIVFPKVMMQEYEKNNGGGKIRLIKLKEPLRVYGNVIGVGIDELRLQQYLNAAVDEFVNSSSYDRIVAPYNAEFPGAFMKPLKPYVLQ
jgi:polar amino acid transport system substrate-binding protein